MLGKLQRNSIIYGSIKFSHTRHVWDERGPSENYKKLEKKIGSLTDTLYKENSSISTKNNNERDIYLVEHQTALTSLELALSECLPYSVSSTRSNNYELKKMYKYKNGVKKLNNPIKSKKLLTNNNLSHEDANLKCEKSVNKAQRINEMNIQMLSTGLFEQLFGNDKNITQAAKDEILRAQGELRKYDLLTAEKQHIEDVNLKLPPLEGGNLIDHFHIIGEQQSRPYRILLEKLLKTLPEMPKEWVYQAGWTKYKHFEEPQSVPFPDEDALVFDIEVCRSVGEMPTIATAASPNAWYSWVSETLLSGSRGTVGQHHSTKDLIPMESSYMQKGIGHGITKPKVVVGHNVSYDRARIKEQYWLEGTGMRFVDTLSLHVCVSGVSSYQRLLLKSASKGSLDNCETDTLKADDEWLKYSSLNNLSEVHKLYCGSPLDKTTRDVFVSGTLDDVNNQFQTVMQYCASDVSATHEVLQKLLPLFLSRFPHPVTLAGMLELGTAYLPVNSNWNRYLTDSQQTFEDLDSEARFLLAQRADNVCQLLHEDKYKEDLWMWDQDWSIQELKLKKHSGAKKKKTIECCTLVRNKSLDNGKLNPVIDETVNKKHMQEDNCLNKNSEIHCDKNNDSLTHCDEDEFVDEQDELIDKFQYLIETCHLLPAKMPYLPGYPAWYRKLCPRPSASDWVPGPQLVSTSMQITPKLVNLTWESYPLHYIRGSGWGFLVPYNISHDKEDDKSPKVPIKKLVECCPIPNDGQLSAGVNESEEALSNINEVVEATISRKAFHKKNTNNNFELSWYKGTGIWCNVTIGGCCWFLKLPHKDGSNYRVGNPLAKDFLNKFSENVLAGTDKGAEKVLAIGRMLSYWRNNCERIEQQLVIWLPTRDLPRNLREIDTEFGAILPQVIVCGTLTRRAVEPTWMTASNAHKERIGSELRAMVQAPPGYSIVGADVDSQELWIASMIGDAHFAKMHGATPLGWMTLSGNKADRTDMHSATAKAVGISRDHAKVINYARIYGAGQQFAERLLKQFNPSMSDQEARKKANKMFTLTKGRKKYRLKASFCKVLEDRLYSTSEALRLRKQHGLNMDDMFEHPQWVGGTESAMFNRLEEIANSKSPITPFLGAHLSRALEPSVGMNDRYLPTRVNWVVQSGAVDFLHLMLVSMRWLLDTRARFCISFHDEVHYLVPDEQKYQAALALHITNLLARAFCARQLGLCDLPQSVAFFASVEVDTVLRKEAHHDCCTPSNPHGLSRGYGIPQGESLDIQQALEKAGGSFKAVGRRIKRRPDESGN